MHSETLKGSFFLIFGGNKQCALGVTIEYSYRGKFGQGTKELTNKNETEKGSSHTGVTGVWGK